MSDILLPLLMACALSAAIPLLGMLYWKPADRSERAVLTGISLILSGLIGLTAGLMPANGMQAVTLLLPLLGMVLTLCLSYLSITVASRLYESALLAEVEMSGRISRFALANFARLDLEGEDFISIWTLNEAQRLDNWKPEELELIKLMIANIDRIGHMIGVVSGPILGGSAHASLPVYNICRADLESYEGRAKRRLWNWQHGSWCAQLT